MKCIRCGVEISDESQICEACGLPFTDEMRKQMLDYKAQMEEYNRQMEEYNRQMEEYNRRQQEAKQQSQPIPEQVQPISEQIQPVSEQVQPVSEQIQPISGQAQSDYFGQPVSRDIPAVTSVPNILAMLAALVCALSVFLPYASGNDTVSIWDAVSLPIALCFLIPALIIVILSFICVKPVKIINFIVCLLYAGLHIFEFVLTLLNIKSEDYGTLAYGAYINIIAAVLVFISVPVWALIFRPKKAKL